MLVKWYSGNLNVNSCARNMKRNSRLRFYREFPAVIPGGRVRWDLSLQTAGTIDSSGFRIRSGAHWDGEYESESECWLFFCIKFEERVNIKFKLNEQNKSTVMATLSIMKACIILYTMIFFRFSLFRLLFLPIVVIELFENVFTVFSESSDKSICNKRICIKSRKGWT